MAAVEQARVDANVDDTIEQLVSRGRTAMTSLTNASQERVDEAVRAIAWAIYEPTRAKALAELAVTDTGLGNVTDKITKNQRKTFGALRDLLRAKTVGIIMALDDSDAAETLLAEGYFG